MRLVAPVVQFGQTATPPALPASTAPDSPGWIEPHAGPVNGLAFSPDGKYLATAGADGRALICEVASGEWSRTRQAGSGLPGAPGVAVLQVAFSPDNRRIATLAADGTVAFWSVPHGEAAGQLGSPISGATAVEFSPDGGFVAVARAAASGAGEVRLWEVVSGRAASPVLPHAGAVTSVRFNPTGTGLLTASLDGVARVWDLTAALPQVPPLGDPKAPLAVIGGTSRAEATLEPLFSPDGRRVATLVRGAGIRIWETATGRPVTPAIAFPWPAPLGAFSHDGRRLALANGLEPGLVQVFDTATGDGRWAEPPKPHPVQRLSFSPDDQWLVIATTQGVRVVEAASGEAVTLAVKPATPAQDLVFSPDGRWIATCTAGLAGAQRQSWQVQVWNSQTGEALMPARQVPGADVAWFGATVPRMVFSDDGRWLVVCGPVVSSTALDDPTEALTRIDVLEVAPGAALQPPLEWRGLARQCFFAPASDRLLVLGGGAAPLLVRDLARSVNLSLRQPPDHDYRPWEISRDGRWLLGSAQGGWRVWEVASGEPATPVLGALPGVAWAGLGESLAPDGGAVLPDRSPRPQLWPMVSDPRPLEALTPHVQFLAARELDATGSMVPLTPERLGGLWPVVRDAGRPASAAAAQQAVGWHLRLADQSERAGQWFGAEFHLRHLLDTPGDGPQVRQRLARARAQLAFEVLNRAP
jgi:WD40 repeat protein